MVCGISYQLLTSQHTLQYTTNVGLFPSLLSFLVHSHTKKKKTYNHHVNPESLATSGFVKQVIRHTHALSNQYGNLPGFSFFFFFFFLNRNTYNYNQNAKPNRLATLGFAELVRSHTHFTRLMWGFAFSFCCRNARTQLITNTTAQPKFGSYRLKSEGLNGGGIYNNQ